MSDYRVPVYVWKIFLPVEQGRKVPPVCIVELYLAKDFKNKFTPGCRLFSPRVPLHSDARKRYWASHYRLRVNGVWIKDKADYQMFTLDGALKVFAKEQRKQ